MVVPAEAAQISDNEVDLGRGQRVAERRHDAARNPRPWPPSRMVALQSTSSSGVVWSHRVKSGKGLRFFETYLGVGSAFAVRTVAARAGGPENVLSGAEIQLTGLAEGRGCDQANRQQVIPSSQHEELQGYHVVFGDWICSRLMGIHVQKRYTQSDTGGLMSLRNLVLPLALAIPDAFAQDAPKIEFEKFALPNGLQVILHVDRKLPIVHVNEWFHVGSKNERPGGPASRTSSST